MPRKNRRRRGLTPPGPLSLFRFKVREPVSLTLTKAHHEKAKLAMEKLGITRADLVGLLLERMDLETIELTPSEKARLQKIDPFQPSKPETVTSGAV